MFELLSKLTTGAVLFNQNYLSKEHNEAQEVSRKGSASHIWQFLLWD